MLPDDGRPVEYFDTIGGITTVKPHQFLVRTSSVGYELNLDDGVSAWKPCEIRPGEVLTTGIIYMDQKRNKTVSNMKNIFRKLLKHSKSSKKDHDMKYLQCFNEQGSEIMIPLIMTGVFSPIGETEVSNYDAVYSLNDLITAFKLPVKTQLIHSDSGQTHMVPHGVIALESVKEEDYVTAHIKDKDGLFSKTFDMPLDNDLLFFKDVARKHKKASAAHRAFISKSWHPDDKEETSMKDIDLPTKNKNKKMKSPGIIEKLSLRKSKKERASLKALQEEGIFSSRLSRCEVSYDSFYSAEHSDEDEKGAKETEKDNKSTTKVDPQTTTENINTKEAEKRLDYTYSVVRKHSIHDRVLPPLPGDKTADTKSSSETLQDSSSVTPTGSKDPLYEELPLPQPPSWKNMKNGGHYGDEEDGYMVPAYLRDHYAPTYSSGSDSIPQHKPPAAPRDSLRYTRSKRSRMASVNARQRKPTEDDNCPIDIDELFSFTNSFIAENEYSSDSNNSRKRPSSQYYIGDENHPVRRSSHDYPSENRLSDDPRSDNIPKSISYKNLNMNPNATLRSHNVTKVRNAYEVFNFTDSLRELPGSSTPRRRSVYVDDYGSRRDLRDNAYDSFDNIELAGEYAHKDTRNYYAASEPSHRQYRRSFSVSGHSEGCLKHGDDSAISLCSKGDCVYQLDSDYGYAQYNEWHDDGFTPPVDLSNLSVLEVSKSLRYIGMKDRVVIRLSSEQIDGKMLCSLDTHFLKEGFPELNALEVKKIMDFIGGWRPKK